jgi:hypothetical protein
LLSNSPSTCGACSPRHEMTLVINIAPICSAGSRFWAPISLMIRLGGKRCGASGDIWGLRHRVPIREASFGDARDACPYPDVSISIYCIGRRRYEGFQEMRQKLGRLSSDRYRSVTWLACHSNIQYFSRYIYSEMDSISSCIKVARHTRRWKNQLESAVAATIWCNGHWIPIFGLIDLRPEGLNGPYSSRSVSRTD